MMFFLRWGGTSVRQPDGLHETWSHPRAESSENR